MLRPKNFGVKYASERHTTLGMMTVHLKEDEAALVPKSLLVAFAYTMVEYATGKTDAGVTSKGSTIILGMKF